MRAIFDLLNSFQMLVPREAVIGIVIGLLVIGFPGWLHSVRARQLRTQVNRVARSTSADQRRQHEQTALTMAGDHGRRLLVVAEEALRLNQRYLWERAITRLEQLGTHAEDVRLFRRKVMPEAPPPAGDPIEAALTVRRLEESGLHDQARARLEEALQRFPQDPELRELATRVGATAP